MHQDNYFLQSHPGTCVAAWIAIDDADHENGGLVVVPGTHKNQVVCHGEADSTISFATKEVPVPVEYSKKQTELKAGDVLWFHGSLVHGSLPNRSERFRRAMIYHYIPQTAEEITSFYQPLVKPDGEEVFEIKVSVDGGICGETWDLKKG